MLSGVHGSRLNIKALGGAQAVDYTVDKDSKEVKDLEGNTLNFSGSGADAHGPGFYMWSTDTLGKKQAFTNGATYAADDESPNKGFVHDIRINIDEKDLLNNREADEIEPRLWAEVVKEFIEQKHKAANYDHSTMYQKLEEMSRAIEDGDEDLIESLKTEVTEIHAFDFDDEEFAPESAEVYHGDTYEWLNRLMEEYAQECDPIHHFYYLMEGVRNEAVSEALNYVYDGEYEHEYCDPGEENFDVISAFIAHSAITRSSNLWDTYKNMFDAVAVNSYGREIESSNKTFFNAVDSIMANHNVVAATADEGRILVAVKYDEIDIKKVIDMSPARERELDVAC